jgi:hypothetical protein
MKVSIIWKVIIAIIILAPNYANAQFLNKLKEKANKLAADERLNQAVEKAIDKTTNNTNQNHKNNSSGPPTSNPQDRQADKKNDRIITFSPPNENLRPFVLQGHKGLPRFGVLDPELKSGSIDYQIYNEIINLKYNKLTYSDFLRFYSISEKSFAYYFCNEEKEPCFRRFANDGFSAVPRSSSQTYSSFWGGRGANQFEVQRKKNEFGTNINAHLFSWSKSFWENDTQIAYVVNRADIGAPGYDFDKGGFWMQGIISSYSGIAELFVAKGNNMSVMSHGPVNEFESKMDTGGWWVLFKIDESTAERLVSNKIRHLYAVTKVKLAYDSVGIRNEGTRHREDFVLYNFNYESPVAELYEDAALLKKVGEISYENTQISKTANPPNF